MTIKIPSRRLPFVFKTRLGDVQIIIARGGFAAPGFMLNAAAAFACPVDSKSGFQPVQISALRPSYDHALDHITSGFELPFDVTEGDEFLLAVIDGMMTGGLG